MEEQATEIPKKVGQGRIEKREDREPGKNEKRKGETKGGGGKGSGNRKSGMRERKEKG